ncbi:hypothetical protein QJS10_CPB19g00817 [Acorus calamus]|uniref:Uncharacterized protein n=1 Tax=Acorus calamus TaxID=4465 RepID=A0AAV9CHC9_ACOCL|nr:hypothetical protein QJS10_CPB19g00817 [Acorus calamus]
MVFNGALVAAVATTSARLWQRVSCNPERFSSDQVLDLVFCFPLQQLGRLAICLWWALWKLVKNKEKIETGNYTEAVCIYELPMTLL